MYTQSLACEYFKSKIYKKKKNVFESTLLVITILCSLLNITICFNPFSGKSINDFSVEIKKKKCTKTKNVIVFTIRRGYLI